MTARPSILCDRRTAELRWAHSGGGKGFGRSLGRHLRGRDGVVYGPDGQPRVALLAAGEVVPVVVAVLVLMPSATRTFRRGSVDESELAG